MKKIKEHVCEDCKAAYHSYFHNLDDADMQFLKDQKNEIVLKKGQILYKEGYSSTGVFCVYNGKIKIYKNSHEGKEHITSIVLPGELIGLRELLTGTDHSVTACAIEDAVVCFIPKNVFFQLMIKYPEFTRSLIVYLSKLIEEAEARMLSLAYKPMRERLAETLIFLYNSFYPESNDSSQPYLNLTRTDLANIVGSTPETVIRLLSEFKEKKLIRIKGRKIFLVDLSHLKSIAYLS
jgi:CRP/FNR family transcriptional regulator, polysaccharide utilization system transcription regulator